MKEPRAALARHRSPEKPPSAGDRSREAILKAATELFSRRGYAGTRIAEIAESAGLPKANVYYYFSSKKAIYAAIIQHLIAGWDAALRHITHEAKPLPALEAYVREKLFYAWNNKAESRLFATEILGEAPFLTARDRRHMRAATAHRVEVVQAWIDAGAIVPVDARHLFVLLWASTQFYADFETLVCDALERPRLTRQDYDDAARTIVASVLHGLLPRQ